MRRSGKSKLVVRDHKIVRESDGRSIFTGVDDGKPRENTMYGTVEREPLVAVLREVLRYTKHWPDCSEAPIACACGLTQLRARANSYLEPAPINFTGGAHRVKQNADRSPFP